MKIFENESEAKISELGAGDLFQEPFQLEGLKRQLFIRTGKEKETDLTRYYMCVCIDTGKVVYFEESDIVVPIDKRMVIIV